ncbi:MAG: cupin domain-containing protein [Gammaproteobacteria bacterium]|nr:cupin domain-containing protein [Gammaproteobacteria bacterium]
MQTKQLRKFVVLPFFLSLFPGLFAVFCHAHEGDSLQRPAGGSNAPATVVTPLLNKPLGELTNQEALMVVVDLPPGEKGSRHRHDAHTFVYVLDGTVEMQVDGGEKQTLTAGQTFYETPDDVHAVSANASDTKPAKLLVFFVKKQGAPATVPVQ